MKVDKLVELLKGYEDFDIEVGGLCYADGTDYGVSFDHAEITGIEDIGYSDKVVRLDASFDCTKNFIESTVDRLAAYKDTGTTPSEIHQMQSELEMYRKEWEYVYCLDCEYYSCDDNQNENCPHQHECDLCNSEDGRHRFDRPHYKQKDSAKMKEGHIMSTMFERFSKMAKEEFGLTVVKIDSGEMSTFESLFGVSTETLAQAGEREVEGD